MRCWLYRVSLIMSHVVDYVMHPPHWRRIHRWCFLCSRLPRMMSTWHCQIHRLPLWWVDSVVVLGIVFQRQTAPVLQWWQSIGRPGPLWTVRYLEIKQAICWRQWYYNSQTHWKDVLTDSMIKGFSCFEKILEMKMLITASLQLFLQLKPSKDKLFIWNWGEYAVHVHNYQQQQQQPYLVTKRCKKKKNFWVGDIHFSQLGEDK